MSWEAMQDAWRSAQFYSIIVCGVVFVLLYALGKILTYGPRRMWNRTRERWSVGRFWG